MLQTDENLVVPALKGSGREAHQFSSADLLVKTAGVGCFLPLLDSLILNLNSNCLDFVLFSLQSWSAPGLPTARFSFCIIGEVLELMEPCLWWPLQRPVWETLPLHVEHPAHAGVFTLLKVMIWEFPGSLVVRTPHSHCREPGFNPWSGN